MKPLWRPVPRADFRKLHVARMQTHYAVQWLARAARAFLPARADDAHTHLSWDAGFGGFVTQPLPDDARLGLRIADLTLVTLSDGADELALDGRADVEVRRWLGEHLAAHGLKPAALDAPAPYEMPWHVIAIGARYSLDELLDSFETLSTWFANAHEALGLVHDKLAARKLKTPPVRAWPHHFDLDCLVGLGRGRSMGIGFSPGDAYCDEPHFYTTIHPEPPIPQLPLLPAMAHWHTHQFLAALAPAHKIVAADDQGAYVANFFDAATAAALDALRGR
jgi:hypothetical protein